MPESEKTSKLGAILTLAAILAVIIGLGFAAFQLSSARSTATNPDTDQTDTTQSPDLQNINDQFDSL